MARAVMLERHSHWSFVLIGGIGCLASLAMLANPAMGLGGSAPEHRREASSAPEP